MKIINELKIQIKKNLTARIASAIVYISVAIVSAIFGAAITNLPRFATLDTRVAALEKLNIDSVVTEIKDDIKEIKVQNIQEDQKIDYIINRLDYYFSKSN